MNTKSKETALSNKINRRQFLWLTTAVSGAALSGCAVNPVTGKRQLMLMSESQEVAMDQQYSPFQFSADYGTSLDTKLNTYVSDVGKNIASFSHRKTMPYSFRIVNAVYVNAYAFPGGSIACTRGIMLALKNEAELAALLGHEIGHVNARHTAERMSKMQLLNAAVGIGGLLVAQKNETAGMITAGLGMLGSNLLLAKYSRDDERQADALGMEYMVKAGYDPKGMVGLMDVLRNLSGHSPNVIEQMFSSHPMSGERYQTAENESISKYGTLKDLKIGRERYMDMTASIRKQKKAILALQEGMGAMGQQKYAEAEGLYKKALKSAPDDYAGLVMMAHLQIAMDKAKSADAFASKAIKAYPGEAQGHNLSGVAKLMQEKYSAAIPAFDRYEKLLPGDPNPAFLKGFSRENLDQKAEAAQEYQRYLNVVPDGEQAEHARMRLIEWGYMQAPAESAQ